MPPANHTDDRPRPRVGGWRVPNSSVFVPRTATAGATIEGKAPIGSTVEFLGQRIEVDVQGAFSLSIPAATRGKLPVRVVRPDGQTPITVQLEVEVP